MSLYSKFCAWLSGWPESSKYGRDDTEEDFLFAEEEKKERMRTAKKPKGLKPKKKKKRAK
jgi:hypothetical protein|tara:strand:- start:861 stop:1040 length:180 start_codon:yes stop_codon:yes gene_type:complete